MNDTLQDSMQMGLFSAVPKPEIKPEKKIYSTINVSIKTSLQTNSSIQASFLNSIKNEVNKFDKDAQVNLHEVNEKSWFDRPFYSLDVETTGFDPAFNQVIEVALVPFNMGENADKLDQLISINGPVPPEIIQITGIDDAMLKNKPKFEDIAQKFLDTISKAEFIVAYNAKFDRPFIESELARVGLSMPPIPWVDPYIFVCDIDKFKKGKKLVDSAKRWGIELNNAHRAYDDAQAAGNLLLKMKDAIGNLPFNELLKKQMVIFWQHEQNMASFKKKNEWFVNR